MPPSIPLPPLSIPTYLQLELAADRPSPLYIYRPATSDFPYESARIKYERLLNFLLLPPQLEQTIVFGFFACLDAWLYSFTILPLRFFKALYVLADWMVRTIIKEFKDIGSFIYWGIEPRHEITLPEQSRRSSRSSTFRHRRTKSKPSLLMPTHKADILKGLLVIASCFILMRLDASRMYHSIRGQAAIKLYVIYNVLEVCDRLFSALGQDVLECLFSRETLERNPDGRSKILRPFWMFLLALIYNVIHSTALFYQVITLNVAVNSYSNALLTLLMSNQFVEIKGTVFKKFEKENLFQMTCADIVERFQLSLMLSIIVLRNVFEVGVLGLNSSTAGTGSAFSSNATTASFKGSSIIPKSFTVFPNIGGQVFGPFLLVLGSECLVDWLKHAYITKFNNTKPAVYGRFLDLLAKDYYSHAFADQNLTKRLGLPVLPLSCLFIRAIVQTYRMFIETHMPIPLASTVTGLTAESASTSSPATTAALAHIDQVFRRALGRSSFGAGMGDVTSSFSWWSMDDLIAFATMLVVWLLAWFVLLSIKLVLGMLLLSFARKRYTRMKEKERLAVDTGGKRIGGWGVVEVDDDKRRWVYVEDKEGLQKLRDRDARVRENEEKGWDGSELNGVSRYSMVAKRIW
ncbi:DUF747-domain-containing protein [Pseudovirgaria hyperparasitica]|uniref:DUF747-domain-containing protein n=1 Tax=Pseudovirgaria hyperparasitica TaxID=470096 RepID=A0A6A6WFB0_9PEZI|nr:DUF747-domain-containing protein [Pseudovirgaria hyperparasitica]KAF2760267.1 DUF747-domain-containing protein [Pseudovirgaria hyperparasitica]